MVTVRKEDVLMKALNKLGEGSGFLWLIFIFTITPQIFTGMHSMSYTFIAEIPTHWCSIPVLIAANWTDEQIRNISSVDSCSMYDYNYTEFAQMGFEKALIFKHEQNLPNALKCSERSFANDIAGTSLVQDWDLVCNRIADRTNTYTALSLGKLLGSYICGFISDKFGRKTAYTIGIVILMISGPTSAIIPWYWGFVMLRLFTGISFSTIQMSSFTTLTEVAGKKHRQWMGIAFNCGYPIGTIIIACVAYTIRDWRKIQLVTTLPTLFLFVPICYMPESPRWLITHKYRVKAKNLIVKYYGPIHESSSTMQPSANYQNELLEEDCRNTASENTSQKGWKSLKIMFCHKEFRRRAYISYFAWWTSALTYYALALNADNISADRYIYTLIMGLSEIPAYLLPAGALILIGRKFASSVLFFIGALCLLIILIIPETEVILIMVIALIGRFALSAVFGIIILYCAELFPTICRNTATGVGCSIAHTGSVTAPYISDFLGLIVWWGPTTVCGILALMAGFLCLMLPETGYRPLANTVEQELTDERGKVMLLNCCKCTR